MFSTGQLSLRARGDCAGKDVCSAREGELLDELLDVLDKLLDELLDEQWSDLGSLHSQKLEELSENLQRRSFTI